MTKDALAESWKRHLAASHRVNSAKAPAVTVKETATKPRPGAAKGNIRPVGPTKKALQEHMKAAAKTKRLGTLEAFVSTDMEWVPSPGDGPLHHSPLKVGPDGYPRYERYLISPMALATMRGGLPQRMPKVGRIPASNNRLTMESPVQEPPTATAAKARNDARSTEGQPRKESAVSAQVPAASQALAADRSGACTRLGVQLMTRLRNLDSFTGSASVLQGFSDSELLEAQRICQALIARLEVQTSMRGK